MPGISPFSLFTSRFDRLGVPYMVTGSVAVIVYGEPRLTHDIDIVARLEPDDCEGVVNAFPLEEFYCPPIEVLHVEHARRLRGHFNLIHHETGFKADVYLAGEDPLHQWGLDRIRLIELDGQSVPFAPPEYVILRKLEFYAEGKSEKHLRDIRSILLQRKDIDRDALAGMVARRGLGESWRVLGVV